MMNKTMVVWAGAAVIIVGLLIYGWSQRSVNPGVASTSDTAVASTTPQATHSKTINIKGSDTEVQLVSDMAEAFSQANPGADIAVAGGGSGTGITALISGEVDVADSSRAIADKEKADAVAKGHQANEFVIGRDGLSIVTNPANPVKSLTMEQLGKVFAGTITNWKDVGGKDAPIVLYGRQNTSGTYTYFQEEVLKKGNYSPRVRSMEGNQAIIDSVKTDVNGVGYVGLGYVVDDQGKPVPGITVVPLTTPENGTVSSLDTAAVLAGKYPLFRPLYQYVSYMPTAGSDLDKFLRFEVSDAGKQLVKKAGFLPLISTDEAINAKLLSAIK